MGSEMKHKKIKTMKKILIVLLAALLVLGAVGCRKAEPEEEVLMDAPLSGGWTPAADYEVSEARKAVFDKGTAELDINYAPLAYLGSQVVAGTNHVFLSRGIGLYALIYVYESLQGDVQLMNIAALPIIPQEDGTLAAPEEGLMGGWSYAEDPAVTDEMQERLAKALEDMVGATYVPVANLGVQVVAGLNRCLLCQITPLVPDAEPHYALVYVYEKVDGGAELSQVIDLDVGAFCTYGA